MIRLLLSVLVVFGAAAVGADAQSLAELARKEELRRKDVKESGKVYTNADLKRDITMSPPAPDPADPPPADPNAAVPATGQVPVSPDTKVPSVNLPGGKVEPPPPPRDEKYWRTRIETARTELDRLRIFAEALQSNLNALAADIINRDDPIQRTQLEQERNRKLAELQRVNAQIEEQTKTIAAIEEEARRGGVPPGWLRPPGL